MTIKNIAIAGLVAVIGSASSAFAISVATGDLILGFAASAGTGSTTNVELNLGAVSSLVGSSTTPSLIAALGTDLQTYGADWNTRSDVTWGVTGYLQTGVSSSTLWGTKAETTVGTQTSAYAKKSYASQGTPGGRVAGLVAGLQAASQAGLTNSALLATSDNYSWTAEAFVSGSANAFLSTYPLTQFLNTTNITGQYLVSDLFQMDSASTGTGTYIGSLGLDNSGNLYFAKSASAFTAIPEPSTYAMILGALTLGVVAARRRMVKRA